MDSRPWIVQKYGGTSIGKLLEEITDSIIPQYLQDYNVAVVCSARSGSMKSAGTTSLLLKALALAVSDEVSIAACGDVIDTIKNEHLLVANSLVISAAQQDVSSTVESLRRDISKECEKLRRFLHALRTIGEVSDRAQDKVLGVGEKLSCLLVTAALAIKGVKAEMLSLDNIVQVADKRSIREQQVAYRQSPARFLRAIPETIRTNVFQCIVRGNIPIITGFFGSMPNSLLHTVGRGYSDLCAALCAIALGAEELQIWKEVDGIFTADPTKVSTARVLATVTAEEATELTYYGSEVIHPLTMSLLSEEDVSLRLKNVRNPNGSGTIIYSRRSANSSPTRSHLPGNGEDASRLAFMNANGYHGYHNARRVPTAITAKESIVLVNITSNGKFPRQTFQGQIIQMLGKYQLALDLSSSSNQSISLVLSSANSIDVDKAISEASAELEEFGTLNIGRKMSIISVVGHKMRNMVGVAAEIFSALASARINIYLISQGANEINISFVVKVQDTMLALEVVHTKVMGIPGHSERERSLMKGPWLY